MTILYFEIDVLKILYFYKIENIKTVDNSLYFKTPYIKVVDHTLYYTLIFALRFVVYE